MSNWIRRLGDLRGPDVLSKVTSRSIFVQPLGAIEQHGPHLPLNTDEIVATAVAEATVERVGEKLDVWLLPTLTYTKSNEHAWAPGTIWLSATTMLSVLDDIGRCVSRTNAQKLVFLNGHGGNSALLNIVNRELREVYCGVILRDWFKMKISEQPPILSQNVLPLGHKFRMTQPVGGIDITQIGVLKITTDHYRVMCTHGSYFLNN